MCQNTTMRVYGARIKRYILRFMFKTYSSSSSLVITSRWFATSRLVAPVSVRLVYSIQPSLFPERIHTTKLSELYIKNEQFRYYPLPLWSTVYENITSLKSLIFEYNTIANVLTSHNVEEPRMSRYMIWYHKTWLVALCTYALMIQTSRMAQVISTKLHITALRIIKQNIFRPLYMIFTKYFPVYRVFNSKKNIFHALYNLYFFHNTSTLTAQCVRLSGNSFFPAIFSRPPRGIWSPNLDKYNQVVLDRLYCPRWDPLGELFEVRPEFPVMFLRLLW